MLETFTQLIETLYDIRGFSKKKLKKKKKEGLYLFLNLLIQYLTSRPLIHIDHGFISQDTLGAYFDIDQIKSLCI